MRSRVALVVVAVLVVVAGVGGVLWWRERRATADAAARAAVTAYVAGWETEDMSTVPFADEGAAADFEAATEGLGGATVDVSAGQVSRDGDSATTELAVRWTLPGAGVWSYAVPARVVSSGHRWEVAA